MVYDKSDWDQWFLLLPLRTSSSGVITLIFVNLDPFRTKFVYVVPNAIKGF